MSIEELRLWQDSSSVFYTARILRIKHLGALLAFAVAVAMWCYADLVLVPYQLSDAARTGRPRGNLSDLYPRWLGSRELLLHGRNPYSPEITREIQEGYYGRPLDPRRPSDPKDQQAFAYPVYVALLLAPSVLLPFSTVQTLFRWTLFLVIAASVLLWLSMLQWRLSATAKIIAIILVLGSFPAVQAIKLQQLSAVVCLLLAGCAACVVNRHLAAAGLLLALATIKPQLALPFAAWLGLWTFGDWRSRRRLLWSFLASLSALIVLGELFLPGWIGEFGSAAAAYLQYAGGTSLSQLALTPAWGRLASILLVVLVAYLCWPSRRASADSESFRWNTVLVLSTILAIIPTFAPYNQLLLVPGFLLLVQQAPRLGKTSARQRILLLMVFVAVVLPWLVAVGLDLSLLLLPHTLVEKGWPLPLWTSWAIPFPLLAAVGLRAFEIAREQNKATRHLTAEVSP